MGDGLLQLLSTDYKFAVIYNAVIFGETNGSIWREDIMTKFLRTRTFVHQQKVKITQRQRNVFVVSGMASLLILVGFVQSWNVALDFQYVSDFCHYVRLVKYSVGLCRAV